MRTKSSQPYIGDIAKELGLSQRALRYYEELGIIKPVRTDGGFRTYSSRDIEVLKMVVRFKELGMSLDDIRAIIMPGQEALRADILRALRETLAARRDEFEEKIRKYMEGIEQIDRILRVLSNCATCGRPSDNGVCEECLKQRGEDVLPLINTTDSHNAEEN